jgi:hypothetical protein
MQNPGERTERKLKKFIDTAQRIQMVSEDFRCTWLQQLLTDARLLPQARTTTNHSKPRYLEDSMRVTEAKKSHKKLPFLQSTKTLAGRLETKPSSAPEEDYDDAEVKEIKNRQFGRTLFVNSLVPGKKFFTRDQAELASRPSKAVTGRRAFRL